MKWYNLLLAFFMCFVMVSSALATDDSLNVNDGVDGFPEQRGIEDLWINKLSMLDYTLAVMRIDGDSYTCSEQADNSGTSQRSSTRLCLTLDDPHHGAIFQVYEIEMGKWLFKSEVSMENGQTGCIEGLIPNVEYGWAVYYCDDKQETSLCTDTDGKDIFKKGTVNTNFGDYFDKCEGEKVREYYCSYGIAKSSIYDCKNWGMNVCSNGICVGCDAQWIPELYCKDGDLYQDKLNSDCTKTSLKSIDCPDSTGYCREYQCGDQDRDTDTDGDGIPDYQDPDADGNGVLDDDENVSGFSPFLLPSLVIGVGVVLLFLGQLMYGGIASGIGLIWLLMVIL